VTSFALPSPSSSPRLWEPTEHDFDRSLEIGLDGERRVGLDLFELGYWVIWPNPPHRAKDPETFAREKPDLIVLVGGRGIGLEIKHVKTDFSGPDDFPYKTAFVGKLSRWDKRSDDPWAVVILSRGPKGGRLVIPVATRGTWVVERQSPPMLAAPRRCWRTWDWLIERFRHPVI